MGLRADPPPSIIGGTCAFDAKNRVFFGWLKFVNAYVKRGKKKFDFWDFWFQVCAHLIEKFLDSAYGGQGSIPGCAGVSSGFGVGSSEKINRGGSVYCGFNLLVEIATTFQPASAHGDLRRLVPSSMQE